MKWLPVLLMLCGLGAGPSWFIATMIETVWQTGIPTVALGKSWLALRTTLPGGQHRDDQSAFAATRARY
jgi:hypothetical protein